MVPKTRWFLGLGLALLASSSTVSALTIQKVGAGLFVQGPIREGDYQRFSAALNAHGNATILLDSPGGTVYEALKIAELIRTRQLPTHLPQKATCASACVLVFAGGVIRTADPSARIGVHMGSGLLNERSINMMRKTYREYGAEGAAVMGAKFEQAAALAVLKQVDFYLNAGVSLRLLQVSAAVDYLDIKWLSMAEAKEYNIVNSE